MIKINISTKPKMGFYELNIMFEDEIRFRFIVRAIGLTAKSKRTGLGYMFSLKLSMVLFPWMNIRKRKVLLCYALKMVRSSSSFKKYGKNEVGEMPPARKIPDVTLLKLKRY
ncbi:hypothetical protein [Fictibacillus terranigra]|uniref:Uncharacterized protein n=1 Tax=Fictibacillus terranigra TaxID=3058424 RepID=A0ABT8EDJ7_9BACL|nr:hypothetical protein [Fictibacillus sp. CENA-BCM004]MDN4076003.1 hypothetical protein [Fictibacillus sp. CENA-BCM004]